MKRIVVLGPESTGKSTLCTQLAAHYQTLWVPEYARTYLDAHGTHYTYEDLLHIAKEQQQQEAAYADRLRHSPTNQSQLLIIDTNQYVMKVWCEVVFGNCHEWILKQAAQQQCDLYLLCNIDLPWVQDGMREYPDLEMRRRLFHEYKDIVVNDGAPWAIVSGTGEERLRNAVAAIDQLTS